MRCLGCGAEMRVAQVAPEDNLPVLGYELRTLECPQCGDTERRLAFSRREPADAEAALTPDIAPHDTATRPAASKKDTAVIAPAPSDTVPGAKWGQAVEKVRMRRTILAQQAAPPKAAETTATVSAPTSVNPPAIVSAPSDDFDRVWESLASPAPLPLRPEQRSRSEDPPRAQQPSCDVPGDTAPRGTTDDAASLVPAKPQVPVAAAPASSDVKPTPKSSDRLWTRALAMLRGRLERMAGPEHQNAILQINADALQLPRTKAAPSGASPRAVPINTISAGRARARQ
jgi:hypothetical protein